MLQSIREHSQGWLAWLIVGLISIPFALWGINSYLDGGSNVNVARINGVDISLSQYQNAMQNYRERLQTVFGDSVDINGMDQNSLKQDVINALVEQQVLKQFGQNTGMRISDNQVASMIQSLDSFKDESGQFSNAIYQRSLLRSNASPVMFEQQLRGDMIQDQLRQAISGSAFVTDKEKNQIGQLQAQKRSIIYTIITAEQYKEDIQISEEQIAEYYEQQKENYKTEESVSINYIDLSVEELAKNIDVSDEILQEYFQSNLDKYSVDERRVAQRILVALAPDADSDAVKKARASAEKLLELVKSGVDFDDIPQAHANLLGAKDEVGKTGAVPKGKMDPEFDEALFSMNEGDFSEVIRGKAGLHVIKLLEIQASKVSTFDEAKESVDAEYRKEQAEAKYYEVADELQNLVFENPDSLEVAAETLDLKIKQTASFTRKEGEELSRYPNVLKAAFSQEVIQGANSEPLELSDTRLVVLRAFDHKPAAVKAQESVQKEIETALLNNKAKAKAEEQGSSIVARLKEGIDLDQLANEESFEWTKTDSVSRDDPNVKRSILRSVFKLGRPAEDKPIYEGFSDGLYDFAIVGVTAVADADLEWSGIDESTEKATQQLQQQRDNDAWQNFVTSIKQKAEIDMTSEAL